MAKKQIVLVIPDLHAPAIHKDAFDFVRRVQDKYKTTRTVFLGDIFDLAACSYHSKELGLPRALAEVSEAREQIQPFYDHFNRGKVDMLVGNHDHLICRKASDAEIPEQWIKPIKDIFGMPKNWKVTERFGRVVIDNVQYKHGDSGSGGSTPAIAQARASFMSTVIGHYHGSFGCNYFANDNMRVFGCDAGSLCDSNHLAQKYAKKYPRKPVRGMAVVEEGVNCFNIVMPSKNKGCK